MSKSGKRKQKVKYVDSLALYVQGSEIGRAIVDGEITVKQGARQILSLVGSLTSPKALDGIDLIMELMTEIRALVSRQQLRVVKKRTRRSSAKQRTKSKVRGAVVVPITRARKARP